MRIRPPGTNSKKIGAVATLTASLLAPLVLLAADRINFKPGFNLYAPSVDVSEGRKATADVEKHLPLVTDPEVVSYVNQLGKRLAQVAPVKNDYPWAFKVVNSREINAFALPGGFIFVNRGAIEAAEDEAQIAGVIGHEEGHVVMRHGTHQASQMILAKAPLAVLGGLLSQDSGILSQVAQLGIGVGVEGLFLKNSRTAESQADEVGTYILYHSGYDPRAMSQFFEIIQSKYPQKTLQFFSDHPNPENRVQKVDELIPRLGPQNERKTDSAEFRVVKKRLLALQAPPQGKPASKAAMSPSNPPPAPSAQLVNYQGEGFSIDRPDNWEVQSDHGSVTMAPRGAILAGPAGETIQAYGVSIVQFQPSSAGERGWGLIDGTNHLVESMRRSNPNMRVLRQDNLNLLGRPAISTQLEMDSAVEGQKERDDLVTLRSGDRLLALVFIAPEPAIAAYKPTFDAMLQSLQAR